MARVVLTFRAGEKPTGTVDQMATESDCTRADVLRAALYVALKHETELRKTIEQMKEF